MVANSISNCLRERRSLGLESACWTTPVAIGSRPANELTGYLHVGRRFPCRGLGIRSTGLRSDQTLLPPAESAAGGGLVKPTERFNALRVYRQIPCGTATLRRFLSQGFFPVHGKGDIDQRFAR